VGEGLSAEPVKEDIERLLASADVPTKNFQLSPIPGGGNNRSYRLTTADGATYFLKWYFRHPDDPRDRLNTEFAFASFCRRHGVDEVPQPYARDDEAGLGLYEFIIGRRLTADEIDNEAIDTATTFFRRINEHRDADDAKSLPIASEACFSIQEHLDRIDGRIQRLVAAAAESAADSKFRSFVERRLAPHWDRLQAQIAAAYEQDGDWPSRPLSEAKRRLSPSDFGFHNVLKMPDGRLRFIDLEYAGWDDPAKTHCDFRCQVQVPVPSRLSISFLEDVESSAEFRTRCRRLFPAYQLKWCCIVLNDFLPAGSARRAFGTAREATPERRSAQLQKAIDLYNQNTFDFGASEFRS
jgi:hypothetical protein